MEIWSFIYVSHNKGCTFRAFNKYDNRQLRNDIAAIHRQCES